MVENHLFELLVDLLLFSQNYVTLSFNSLRLEFGVLEDVREDIDCSRDVGVEGLGIVDGVFALCK